jgi:hypothetical protein
MRAVFAVLKKTGFAWKTSSPYSLRCRSGGTSTAATTGVTPPPSVKIALQLFKVRDDRYLVDLKYLEGPVSAVNSALRLSLSLSPVFFFFFFCFLVLLSSLDAFDLRVFR